MKRLIIFLLLFAAIKVAGQTTGYLRFDTVMIYKVGGTAELVLMNKTKDSLGVLVNYYGGRTRFMRSRAINDSTIVVGLDTMTIRGASGGASRWELDGSNNLVNKAFPGVKIEIDKRLSILDSGYVATSNLTGTNPGEGVGYKTFWHPGKAAFRSGYTDASSFNDAFIGQYSTSFGYNATAIGLGSFSAGIGTLAQGQGSIALGGSGTQATGANSIAGGLGSVSGGLAATAFGNGSSGAGASSFAVGFGPAANGVASAAFNQTTRADADYSAAFGQGTHVNAQAGFVAGYFNFTNYTQIIPQFVIGRFSDTTISSELFRIGWGSHVGGPKANIYSMDTAGQVKRVAPNDATTGYKVMVWDPADGYEKKVDAGDLTGGAITTQLELPLNVKTPADTTQPDTLFWDYGFYKYAQAVTSTTSNKRNDMGVFVPLGRDTVLHLFTEFGLSSGDSDSSVIARQWSYDGGRTWTTPAIVIDDGGLGDMIPSAVELAPNGDILVVYLHNLTTTTNELRKRVSTDRGVSFGGSTPGTKIHGDANEYYAPKSDVLGFLKNGNLFYTFSENTAAPLQSQTGNYVSRYLISTDQGGTWSIGADDIDSPDSLSVEPDWTQTDNGQIQVWLRTRSGYAALATSDNNGTSFSMTSLTNLPAVNSTNSIEYDEQFGAWLAVNNRPIGGGTPILQRLIMDVSVSRDMYTWKKVLRLDSATDYHFIEPYVKRIRDEYLIGYSKGDNATGAFYDIKAARIPVNVIFGTAQPTDNAFNNIDIVKGFNGVSSYQLRLFSRKLGATAGYTRLGGQTSGDASYNPWLEFKSSTLFPLIHSEVPSGQQGLRFNMFVAGSTAIGNTTTLVDFQNNGSTRFSIFGDGRIRLASFAGDVTSPSNGDVWYNSTSNKFRARENGATVDLIGAGGGSFIASNGATTLTANSFVTQSSFTFGLNEQLLLGSSTPVSSVYLLQLKKVGATTFLGIFNDDNNANGNIVRADKTRAGSYAITATDKVLEFNGNSVATFGLYAGSILGADNFRNLNFQFKSRLDNEAISDKFVVMNDGLTQLFKKGGTGSNTDHFALFQSDLSTTNAYLRVNNGTTGTGGAASFIYTRGLGTFAGYGVSWDLNTTAANAGFDINVHNAGAAVTGTNGIYTLKSNGTVRVRVNGDGSFGIGTTGPDRILDVLHASNPQLRLTQADGTVYGEFQVNSSGNLYFTGSNTSPLFGLGGTTSSFPALIRDGASIQVKLADNSANANLKVLDQAYNATTWNGNDEVPTKNAIRDYNEALNLVSSTYTPTFTLGTNVDGVTAPGTTLYYQRIGNQVTVWGNISVDATAGSTTTNFAIDLPVASAMTGLYHLSGQMNSWSVGGGQGGAEADVTNDRANFSFQNGSATSAVTYTIRFSYEVL